MTVPTGVLATGLQRDFKVINHLLQGVGQCQ